jgi:hypothetical protein
VGELFLEKMEIGESFFGKKHGKLTSGRNLASKKFPCSLHHDTSFFKLL